MASRSSRTVSRRNMLKRAAAAAGGGAAALVGRDAFARPVPQGGAPAILTGTQAGRRVRAVAKYRKELASVEEITLRAIGPRSVVIRVEACQACYSQVTQALIA